MLDTHRTGPRERSGGQRKTQVRSERRERAVVRQLHSKALQDGAVEKVASQPQGTSKLRHGRKAEAENNQGLKSTRSALAEAQTLCQLGQQGRTGGALSGLTRTMGTQDSASPLW